MKFKLWVSIIVLLAFVAMPFAGELEQSTIKIKGMKCQGCADLVTKALKSVKGVETVIVDLKKGIAQVGYTKANLADMEKAILALGFEANNKKPSITHEEWEAKNPEAKAECEAKARASGKSGCGGEKSGKLEKSKSKSDCCPEKAAPEGTKL